MGDGIEHTGQEVRQEDEDILDDIGLLACGLEHRGLSRFTNKEGAVAIEISFYNFLPSFGLLRLINSADAGQVVLCDGACSNSAIPGDWPLADVVLQRGQVGGRIKRHGGESREVATRAAFWIQDAPMSPRRGLKMNGVDGFGGAEGRRSLRQEAV